MPQELNPLLTMQMINLKRFTMHNCQDSQKNFVNEIIKKITNNLRFNSQIFEKSVYVCSMNISPKIIYNFLQVFFNLKSYNFLRIGYI